MDDGNITFSAASIWNGLKAPVLALAEELALRRAVGERPATELLVRSGGIDVMRQKGSVRELLLQASGRPQQALQAIQPGSRA